MKTFALLFALLFASFASAQSWTTLKNTPPTSISGCFLMHDGTVLCQDPDNSDWYKLTPDSKGSYVNGTWSQVASMPSGYGPLYYASAVLPDGRLIVCGGEYNLSNTANRTNLCAIYNPATNSWSSVPTPKNAQSQPWSQVGDAASIVLPNGQFMLANYAGYDAVALDPATLTWSAIGANQTEYQNEQGWTLLPDNSFLTVDCFDSPNTERYLVANGTWISAGATPSSIIDINDAEVGPAVLRYDGRVWATGGNGNTAFYAPPANYTDAGTWTAGPTFPSSGGKQLDIADGAAAMAVDGTTLCVASPGYATQPSTFFSFDGTTLTQVAGTFYAPYVPSYVYGMLCLPSGQIMVTSQSNDVEVWTPAGGPQNSWRPTITSCPYNVGVGTTQQISGTQFNGLSQGSAYGDDLQNATNYPMVRIANTATGDVQYCTTSGYSTMGVATGSTVVSASFTTPANIETGPSTLEVVANGIASQPFAVDVGSVPVINSLGTASVVAGSAGFSLNVAGVDFLGGAHVLWTNGSTTTALTTAINSSNSATATVPTSLLAKPGAVSVEIANPGNVDSNTKPFTILAPIASFTIGPSAVYGGTALKGNVTLSQKAPSGGMVVSFTTNAPGAITMPAPVTIGAGGLYTIVSFATAPVPATISATITAKANGITTTASVKVLAAVLLSITVNQPSVTGGGGFSGKVNLNHVTSSIGAKVSIGSSNGLAAYAVGDQAVLGAGVTSGTWTGASNAVNADTVVTLTATFEGVSKTVSFTVLEARIATLALSPTGVTGGSTSTATVTMNGKAASNSVTLNLLSNNPNATVPATATISRYGTSTTFTIHTRVVTTAQTATISVKQTVGAGTVTLTKTLTINP